MRTLHVITGLNQGGAERQLGALVTAGKSDCAVFSLLPPGPMSRPIREAGIPLFSGGAHNSLSPIWIPRLRQVLKRYQPSVVMGWMYHGNLAATLTRLMGHKGPVLWNVRHSLDSIRQERLGTQYTIRAGAPLSGRTTQVVYNSTKAARQHEALGYDPTKTAVIPNGFDTDRFRPSEALRRSLRRALGVGEEDWLLGVVGRDHPMKNHRVWLGALSRITQVRSDVYSMIIGRGIPDALDARVSDQGLQHLVFLREATSQPEFVYPAFDLLILPSAWGEGFPNVVGEAMACGVPAVVTPIGDSPMIVEASGFVTADATEESIYESVMFALSRVPPELRQRGMAARNSIMLKYNQSVMANRYESILAGFS